VPLFTRINVNYRYFKCRGNLIILSDVDCKVEIIGNDWTVVSDSEREGGMGCQDHLSWFASNKHPVKSQWNTQHAARTGVLIFSFLSLLRFVSSPYFWNVTTTWMFRGLSIPLWGNSIKMVLWAPRLLPRMFKYVYFCGQPTKRLRYFTCTGMHEITSFD